MVSILVCLWLSIVLLCWIFIITGSKQASISHLKILGSCGLLSLGVVSVLLFTFLLAAKIFWLIMIQEFDPTWIILLLEVLKNNNFGHTVTSVGIML